MKQKEFVFVAIDTIRKSLEDAEKCLEEDEAFNALCYLNTAGQSVLNAILHLHIHTHNPR